jgi:dolichyl-phosphate beta-glucosyltransferase
MTTIPDLSIVIPAYNEERRLPPTLARVREYLGALPLAFEIVVVDDGSRDATSEVARAQGATVVRNERNRGKGFAARRGMLLARGRRRLMTDADLSTPIEDLERLMARLDEGYDVAIASRALPGSNVEVRQSAYREAMGRLFNRCVRVLAVPGLHDTQCGFKLFSAAAAEGSFAPLRLDGFSFDVEALFVARRLGYRIAEVPVTWRNDEASRVGSLNGLRAFLDLGRIRVNGWRGRYG